MAAPLYLIGQTPVNRGVFRLGRTFCRGSGGEPERLSRDRRDVTADRERRGRRRRGRVEDVDGVGGLHDPEIIHERALRRHRLRPCAGAAGADVLGTQRGHEALERFHERALGERAVHLVCRLLREKKNREPLSYQLSLPLDQCIEAADRHLVRYTSPAWTTWCNER